MCQKIVNNTVCFAISMILVIVHGSYEKRHLLCEFPPIGVHIICVAESGVQDTGQRPGLWHCKPCTGCFVFEQ